MTHSQPNDLHTPVAKEASAPVVLRLGFWLSLAVAVAVVIRRLFALANPTPLSSGPTAGLDLAFSQHALLTLAHIIPALCFVVLVPFVTVWRRARAGWAEAFFYPLGAVVGVTAYAMSAYAVGGWVERSAVLVFDSIFLLSLWQAWHFQHLGDEIRERRWLLRAVVILLGIATTRPVMGVFFATRPLTHLRPEQFFGLAFWIGFSINAILIELWLRHNHLRTS